MSWVNVGVATVGIIGGILGSKEKKKAADQARQLGSANASYILAETAEQKARLKFEQERTRGTARTRIAGSGFRSGRESMGGSQAAFLSTLKSVQKREQDWLSKSGKSRADIARRGGESQASVLQSQSTSLLFGAASSALQGYAGWREDHI